MLTVVGAEVRYPNKFVNVRTAGSTSSQCTVITTNRFVQQLVELGEHGLAPQHSENTVLKG